ncbi:calmodulin-binding protein 60 A-like [Nicotiana tomentosiformis]|uniref:calmodulin-binding protein 60 A-like n=1 Tax=Nicotiana tomentosiformis TaxID=4098 RepID=UPI00051BBA11|nr:calmodulin-binding protein 60 A-like [Nicotiana tomentosiformis]
MDLCENSPSFSIPASASFHRKRKFHKLRKSVMAVRVVRLLKSMRRLCVDPAAAGVEPGPVKISIGPRKAQENLNPSDQSYDSRHLELKFSNNINGPIFTGIPIGEEGSTLNLHLIDPRTQNIISSGPEASARVEIVVLEKDFRSCGGDKSLIRGDPYVTLKDGSISVSHISFKHSRVSMRKRELRLGARAVYPYNGTRIVEAVTQPFFVKDRRSMSKSQRPLTLEDEVWKMQTIGKGGPFHTRLMKESIKTVRDLLTQYFLSREKLLCILGRSMHAEKLDAAVNKAKSKLDLKRYVYPSVHNSQQNVKSVVFTDVGEVIGVYQEGHLVSVENLSGTQKAYAMELVKTAFQNGQNIKLLDDDTFKMLCFSSSPNDVSPLEAASINGTNRFYLQDYCPTNTQQQPVTNAYDFKNQINSLPTLTSEVPDPFRYEYLSYHPLSESIWDY